MRDYGKISTSIWGSDKFTRLKDNDNARYLYLYLHSCPHVNSVGCFRLRMGYAMDDLSWDETTLKKGIDSLCEVNLILRNESKEIIYIVDFLLHSPVTNSKHAFGSAKVALALPDCDLKDLVLGDLLTGPYGADVKEKIEALPEVKKRKFSNPERAQVFEKNDGRCVYCNSQLALHIIDVADDKPYMTIDHIEPLAKGGSHEINNLAPSCLSCNSIKGVKGYQKAIDTTEPETEPETNNKKNNLTVIQKGNNDSGKSSKRGTRLPDDWKPSDKLMGWALGENIDSLTIERETAKFKDWWPAQPGQKGVKLDWDRTWKNWLRTAKERQQTNRPRSGGNGFAQLAMENRR